MKASLREEFRMRRAAIGPEDRSRASSAIAQRVANLPLARKASIVALYRTLGTEVSTEPLMQVLMGARREIVLPRVEGDRLVLHAWEPGDGLTKNEMGVEEPHMGAAVVEPGVVDLVVVPGLAFDERGHRLGYGRGFYDRFLQKVGMERRVGVAYDLQVVPELPSQAHDVRVGWVITPTRTLQIQP